MEETKQCQNCKTDFKIESEDFAFYDKIHVPAPTFCPECRMKRRMCWRNVRSLYKGFCMLCNKSLISMYQESEAPIMCVECWNGDNWDPYIYAKDIDWNVPFLNQINEIFKKQPRLFQYRVGGNVVNCDYANSVSNAKNIYLAYSILSAENIMFSENVDNSRDSIDCLFIKETDQCYWNIDSEGNYNSDFQIHSQKNINSQFLYDCVNCQNCCLSSNLRNKSYYFRNKKLSKEQYEIELTNLNLHTYSGQAKAKEDFLEIKNNSINRFAQIYNSKQVTGDLIFNSNNVINCFDVTNCENVSNAYRMIKARDIKDCTWVLEGELQYESISGSGGSSSQVFSAVCFGSQYMEYSIFCRNSKNCFGCVGLKNANYCILNKQYSKEEYESLLPKIKQYMVENPYIDGNGKIYKYGEFFPFSFSPFGYNETNAHDYFPLTKEQAESFGCNWKEREIKEYKITKNKDTLLDSIHEIDESILNEVISCPNEGNYLFQCTTAFKITQNEFDFYKQKNIPLPRFCPNCRHYERVSWRNPLKIWRRQCMNQGCKNTFETSFAPDRPEIVYCESCYQQEVI